MKKQTFTNDFWIYLSVFIVIIAIICFFPYLFTLNGSLDFLGTGQVGDTIGGIMSPFVAIAASILTFLAFWVQYKANEQQRNDIALERFESNLFEMIHIQQDITNNLCLTYIRKNGKETTDNGRDIFQAMYEQCNFGDIYSDNTPIIVGVSTLMKFKPVSEYIRLHELGYLDHYFRHLYRLIKYIKDSDLIDENKKYEYTSIVRANLSQYEIIMLFYNCLSTNGVDKFKPLIEEYALFNNIRVELLAKEEHKSQYTAGAYIHTKKTKDK